MMCLRIDVTIRDPQVGRVYRRKNVEIEKALQEVYAFIGEKYQKRLNIRK